MPLKMTTGSSDMSKTIVPILTFDSDHRPLGFLGTGFFVGEDSILITAAHNVAGIDDQFGIVLITQLDQYTRAELVHLNEKKDVAILKVPGYRPQNRFVLNPQGAIVQNESILCLEYGTTKIVGNEILLSPATRKGNITRQIGDMVLLGKPMKNLLEISFPALRGASGAPVVTSNGFLVVGMLIANASYHLMPVQVERIHNDEGELVEDVQFMLPQALAVPVETLQEVIFDYYGSE